MLTRRTFLAAAAIFLPGSVLAHGESARGAHGGVIGDLGDQHIEMLAKDGEIRIWMLNAQDRPVSVVGATGSLIILAQGRQQTLPLEQAEGAAFLLARGDFRAERGMRVVASIAMPGKPQRQARFTPAD